MDIQEAHKTVSSQNKINGIVGHSIEDALYWREEDNFRVKYGVVCAYCKKEYDNEIILKKEIDSLKAELHRYKSAIESLKDSAKGPIQKWAKKLLGK